MVILKLKYNNVEEKCQTSLFVLMFVHKWHVFRGPPLAPGQFLYSISAE